MLRRAILLLTLFYGFGLLISSCTLMRYDATICDIEFTGLQPENSGADDLTKEIAFKVRSEDYCAYLNLSPITSCYATTKCAVWQNDLDQQSFQLHFDYPVVLNTDTLQPGANILAHAEAKQHISIERNEDCKFMIYTIRFSDDLKNMLSFLPGIYTATFSCATTDGKKLEKNRKVVFKR